MKKLFLFCGAVALTSAAPAHAGWKWGDYIIMLGGPACDNDVQPSNRWFHFTRCDSYVR